MPIYEYRCTSCHDEFEVTQKITDAPLRECPKCNGSLEKLISQSSFVLKGSGWYKTDYAGKSTGSKPAKKPSACAESGSKPSCAGCPGATD
ncbi:MAG: zinc ribbon domain-containing protein [Deferrisomatales bacterium]